MSKLIDKEERDFITGENEDGLKNAIFVKAGAGAGKTHSIKNRVLNLILKKKLRPQELVIITYTKKAAAELQVRIRSIIEENVTKYPELMKSLDELPKAKISTVHSFCYDLLLEYPIEFNLDPESKIIDDNSKDVLLESIKNSFMNHYHEKGDYYKKHKKSFASFENLSASLNEEQIFSFLHSLYDNRDLKPKTLDLSEGESLKKEYLKKFKPLFESLPSILTSIKDGKEEDKLYTLVEEALKKWPKLKTKLKKEDLDELLNDHFEIVDFFKSVGTQTNYDDPSVVKSYKANLKALKESFTACNVWYKLDNYNDLVTAYDAYVDLVSLEKKKRNLIDFFDCLLLVRDNLKSNAILKTAIQKRFKALIIDEYQDSDPIQREIAFSISEDDPSKLVFVGDGKQSIYGFSRADIEVYNETQTLVEKLKGQTLNLTTNFRSERIILNFINTHFQTILTPPKGNEILGSAYESMDFDPKKEKTKGTVEHWSLKTNFELDKKLNAFEKRTREGFLIGKKIKSYIDQDYSLKDFMILFRYGTTMSAYEKGLELAGIPTVNTRSKDFLCRGEIRELLNLLHYLNNPCLFYEEALKYCRLTMGEISDELKGLSKSSLSLQWKFEEAIKILGINEFVLEQNDSFWLEAVENTKNLLITELNNNNFNIDIALERLALKAKSGNQSIKVNDEKLFFESVDAVKLMTIHSAKGLEARFIILAGHETDTDVHEVNFFVDRKKNEIFISPPGVGENEWASLTGIQFSSLLSHIQLKTSEEEKRVLYVALTRAIENLVIVSNSNAAPASFYNPLIPILDKNLIPKIELPFDSYHDEYESLKFNAVKESQILKATRLQPIDKARLISTVNESKAVTKLVNDQSVFKGHIGRTDGMRFGTFVHKTMEVLVHKLRANISFDPDTLIDLLSKHEEPFKDEYIADFKLALKRFMKSDLPEKIKMAKDAQTEIPFAEGSYHGVIDLLLEFDDRIQVIDWKSDLIGSPQDYELIKSHYAKQMDYYASFLKKGIFKEKIIVGECLFSFFRKILSVSVLNGENMLIKVTQENGELIVEKVRPKTLSDFSLKEENLQKILFSSLDKLFPDEELLLLMQSRKWQEEPDLMALDKDGNLYIFELKAWESTNENLLQLLRYGQLFGSSKYEDLERMLQRNHQFNGKTLQEVHSSMFNVSLTKDDFNKKQVFVLMTNGLDFKTRESVNYWRGCGLDIRPWVYRVFEDTTDKKMLLDISRFTVNPNPYEDVDDKFYILNTNKKNVPQNQLDMIANQKAAAYFSPWKEKIKSLGLNATVFLYESGVGAIACGESDGKLQISPCFNYPDEEYSVNIKKNFKLISPPLTASEIKTVTGNNYIFMGTMFGIDQLSGDKIIKYLKANNRFK